MNSMVDPIQANMNATLDAAWAKVDFDRTLAEYNKQQEFVFLEHVLDKSTLAQLVHEYEVMRKKVHRNYMPGVRKGGNLGYSIMRKYAPTIVAMYHSPSFIRFVSRLAGKQLYLKSDYDDHACALYVYTKPGDHMRYHYDTCGCEQGASYTVIIGLIDRSTSRFAAKLHRKTSGRETKTVEYATHPGSMAIFCGSKLYHAVTPLGRNEERVVISTSYVTENNKPSGWVRFKENAKDAILYFGAHSLFQRNYRKR